MECPVCLDDIPCNDMVRLTCYHFLCSSCLQRLIINTCPLCRTIIDPDLVNTKDEKPDDTLQEDGFVAPEILLDTRRLRRTRRQRFSRFYNLRRLERQEKKNKKIQVKSFERVKIHDKSHIDSRWNNR